MRATIHQPRRQPDQADFVEVDELEMNDAIDTAAAALAKQITVKGFRKGKVPKSVMIAHLGGPEALRSEAIRESLPDFYSRAIADTLSDPIGQPDINIIAGEESGELSFEAEVEVRPEISIRGQRELRVTIPSPVVGDEEVNAQVDRFRETDAVLREVDRPIVTGDLVNMDIHVQQIDTGAEPLDMSDYMYTVGSGVITDGVDEMILGLRAGEELQAQRGHGRGRRRHLRDEAQAGEGARTARADGRVGPGEHRVGQRRRDARRHPGPDALDEDRRGPARAARRRR
jgi:trigger factor